MPILYPPVVLNTHSCLKTPIDSVHPRLHWAVILTPIVLFPATTTMADHLLKYNMQLSMWFESIK